jgi:hypothetical protein
VRHVPDHNGQVGYPYTEGGQPSCFVFLLSSAPRQSRVAGGLLRALGVALALAAEQLALVVEWSCRGDPEGWWCRRGATVRHLAMLVSGAWPACQIDLSLAGERML